MNFVLRTAHAEEKKKGVHTNPDVRTIYIYIEIADVPSMWGSLRSPNYCMYKVHNKQTLMMNIIIDLVCVYGCKLLTKAWFTI